MINNQWIDAEHKAVDNAFYALIDKFPNPIGGGIERMFEQEYNCKVVLDPYGIAGRIHFKSEKEKTFFLLKFS